MFLIPRRQIWTQQPQGAVEIDWTHPLAKGLDFAWTPGNQGLDVAAKRPLTIAGATRSVSAQGVGLGFSGGLGALRFTNNADLAWSQTPTIIWVAATAAVENRTILGSRTTPGGLLSAFLITRPDYSLRLEGQNYGSSGYSYQATSTPGTVDGKMHCFAIAKRGNSYHQFYRDGYALSTTTPLSGPVYRQDNAVFEVGGINTGIASYDHNEPFGCFLIFRDPISDADIKALTLNPWQIFKRPDSRIFVPVSSGGGSVNANASGALSAVAVTAPSASASGGASASGALATITISSPTATASAGGSASASGSFAALSISPATATATATKSATASGAFAVVSLSAPTATASGTTAGGANATGTPAQITISHATAIAIGSSVAYGGYQSIGITAPTGSASVGNGNATASGAWAAISITAPTAYASSGFIRAPAGRGPTVIQAGSYRPSQSATSRPSNTGGRRY